ncbi:hypothetical protein [Methanococcoides burtonii]|uniref:Uncharacterized protein n=1 Tax=Methanococcoides burtonii (strain DSM 6242 / NBRC 107633 / OCM 468 / ACE-M) TaxID=259564 RepID=Q12WU0_METBU|nr:hypothetical protein [Methanococcoides burtonii]ABE52086.1 Hypothetical protein Mbur_1163 [Methanococcoides burtonii DSM 6242]
MNPNTIEQVLVLVRATPEKSKRYGHTVCVAGVNQNNELRRLYPFRFNYGDRLIKFKKKDVIEVNITNPDSDMRRESRKASSHKNLFSPLNDEEVLDRIAPLISSIEKLNVEDASLGIVRPIIEDVEVIINSTDIMDKQAFFTQAGEYSAQGRERVKMPVEVRYLFKCEGETTCNGHKIIVLDWEINELVRNIMQKDKDPKSIKEKIRYKMIDYMAKKELYLILGTHFQYKTWMIIGIFYPDKIDKSQKKLFEF